MEFTAEQIESIEKLAGLNYTIRQLAMYFDIKPEKLYAEYEDENSEFRYHFDRGRLFNQALVDQKLFDDAKAGNLTATAIYKKTTKANKLANLKQQLFGI